MDIISIILGILLIVGILSIPKADEKSIEDSKYKLLIQGGRVIKRFAIPILVILLLIFGFRFYQDIKQENELLKIEKERIKAEKEREMTLDKLISIVNKPQHEKETTILGFDFNIDGNTDDGANYSRDYKSEEIENWHSGLVRYITTDKENYVRIRNQISESDFKFLGEFPNNQGDKISRLNKGNYFIWAGTFSDSKKYLVAIEDSTKTYTPPIFFADSEFVGKWGRIGEPPLGQSGSLTVKSDKSFSYTDSESGTISGNWKIEKKEIILNYNSAIDKRFRLSGTSHPLSNKTEVIGIEDKRNKEIVGSLKGESYASRIILRKK